MSELCVAAIVDEPSGILTRFVEWYAASGADRILLFFDNPQHPALADVARLPKVTAIPCTPDFWRTLGTSADTPFTQRQNTVLTHAYHQVQSGWLLNVDADELVLFQGQTLTERLASLPPDARSLRVATAEHVTGPGPGALFRLAMTRPQVNEVYGTTARLFRRRVGLLGHRAGKSFYRAGQTGIRLRQHWAVDAEGNEIPAVRVGAAEGCYLLHYLAPHYAQWRSKLEWRLGSSGFPDAVKEELDRLRQTTADPEAAYRALYETLHVVDADRKARLLAAGGLVELPSEYAPI